MVDNVLNYAFNFLGIALSITLFFAPFIIIFTIRNWQAMKGKRPHFNYFMERFFLSPESNWLVFFWAALEAWVWFVIPEFLLVLLVFMKIHRKFDLVKYDILGTVFGTLLALTFRLPGNLFLQLPYVRLSMLTQVDQWYMAHGIWGLLYQPFSGVPYKVFIHNSLGFNFFWLYFILIAIGARMVRYLVAYGVTLALYPLVHRYVRRHYAILFASAVALFTFLLIHVVAIYQ